MSMRASTMRFNQVFTVLALVTTLVLAGCGGGGGGSLGGSIGSTIADFVADTSFSSFPGVPAGSCQSMTGCAPPYPRNATLLIKFEGPVTIDGLGGFVTQGGGVVPQVFIGSVGPANLVGVDPATVFTSNGSRIEYFAFRNQGLAQTVFGVFDDGTQLAHGGVLGIARNDPSLLVYDPVVGTPNAFGLPFSDGFLGNVQYDIFAPMGGVVVGGEQLPQLGAAPPVNASQLSGTPNVSTVFVTSVGFIASDIPPTVVEVTTASILAGSAMAGAIPPMDTIIVTFDPGIDPATLDIQQNLIVRNTSIVTSTSPDGVIVPVELVANVQNTVFMLTPVGDDGFGAGPYNIEVSVGTNALPSDSILGQPVGAMGVQLELANNSVQTFTTTQDLTLSTPASIGETFATTTQLETDVGEIEDLVFRSALWNDSNSQVLTGPSITGSPLPNTPGLLGDPADGLPRFQFTSTPLGMASVMNPALNINFSAPFDDDQTNGCANNVISGNPMACGTIQNPDGGNRLQLMYTMQQSGQPAPRAIFPEDFVDSIELFEWGATSGVAFGTHIFEGFSMLMGHTVSDAGNLGVNPSQGITATYAENFSFNQPQNDFLMPTVHPFPGNNNPLESPVSVVAAQPYDPGFATLAAQFIPYPVLDLPFDFVGNREEMNNQTMLRKPNLLVDINTPASAGSPIPPSSNLTIGTNVNSPVPPTRLVNSSGSTAAFFLDSVRYHGRFTIVSKNSEAQTKYYDLGAGVGAATFLQLDLVPAIEQRPANTFITIQVQGTTADGFGVPNPAAETPWVTYITRDGMEQPDQLAILNGSRFFRVRFKIEADNLSNTVPVIDGFLLGYSFNP